MEEIKVLRGWLFQRLASERQRPKKLGPFPVWKPGTGPKTSKLKQVKAKNPRNWALSLSGSPARAQRLASEGQQPKKLGPFPVWKPGTGPKTSK